MNRILRLSLGASSALLFTLTGSAQDTARDAKSETPVGIVEQPCPPPITPPASVRDLLVQLFIEPRKLDERGFRAVDDG